MRKPETPKPSGDMKPPLPSAIDENWLHFFLTASYSEECRRLSSEAAKKCGVHRKVVELNRNSN